MIALPRAYIILILYAFVASLLQSCRSSNELSDQFILYDKGQSSLYLHTKYCWRGGGVAELNFNCDQLGKNFPRNDSISVDILLCQDSATCLPIQKNILVLDSALTGSISLTGIDTAKSLFVFLTMNSLVVKQNISFFIHSKQVSSPLYIDPLCNYFSIKDSLLLRSSMILRDTSPSMPWGKSIENSPLFGKIELADTMTLLQGYIYSPAVDTPISPQAFLPMITEDAYPKIQTVHAMYRSLSYIDKSLPTYSSDSIARLYVELFWYKTALKDFVKAKELIRIYYNRVQLANEFFTSYKEGWKTDRGMALILLGLADEIHADYVGETWVYYAEGDAEDITLTFLRIHDSPVYNDLRLERSSVQESIWQRSIMNWKRGDIFSSIN